MSGFELGEKRGRPEHSSAGQTGPEVWKAAPWESWRQISRETFWLIKKTDRFLSERNKRGRLSPNRMARRSEGGGRSKLASDTDTEARAGWTNKNPIMF